LRARLSGGSLNAQAAPDAPLNSWAPELAA
jgi:hypothetical protein